jgi:hypothetical protein
MGVFKEDYPYIIFFIIVLLIAILPTPNITFTHKKFCVVDSVVIVKKYDVMPNLLDECHTSCGVILLDGLRVDVGDTIIYEMIETNEPIDNKK